MDETAQEVRKLRRVIVGIVVAIVVAGGGYVALDAVQADQAEDADVIIDCVNDAIRRGVSSDDC